MKIPKRVEIRTRVIGPTDHGPAYVKAMCDELGTEFSFPQASAPEGREGHERVAVALVTAYQFAKSGRMPNPLPMALDGEEHRDDGYKITVVYA